MEKFRKIFFRAIFFYLILLLFVYFAVDHRKVASHSWPKTLSRLRVEYTYLISISNGELPDQASLVDGMRYFNAIARIFGPRPDTDALKGMSLYFLGNHQGARASFLKLSKDAPGFFWGYYNLALLSYMEKDLSAMEQFCKQAFESPVDKSLAFMMTSKLYQPFFIENQFTPQVLAQNMQRGKAVLLQLLLSAKSGAASIPAAQLPVRVF